MKRMPTSSFAETVFAFKRLQPPHFQVSFRRILISDKRLTLLILIPVVFARRVFCDSAVEKIFANFVSGLIILFEQPIRVGDTVTVGDIDGIVTQIKIRATTIRKWDRKELIVPNREFITGRLLNWSLSDKTLRLEFPVGVAYGSDIKRTEETLYRVARNQEGVIQDDPAPLVIFRSFGESSLDFELRVYIPRMDNYLKIWHEINCAIDTESRTVQASCG